MSSVGLTDPLELEETLLYASVDRDGDSGLRGWLANTMDRLPSWRVSIRERRAQPRSIYCRHCKSKNGSCPTCGEPYVGKPEKDVDTAIVTDMLSLAWQDAYDVAVLITSDADYVPAVERVQERGLKVINAAWAGKGHELKAACWASFDLNTLAASIVRPQPS